MTGAEQLETSSLTTDALVNSSNLQIISRNSFNEYSFETVESIEKRHEENGLKHLEAKQQAQYEELKKELAESFAVANGARISQGIRVLPGFQFSENDSIEELKAKFEESEIYAAIQSEKNKEDIAKIIEDNLQYSGLEEQLFGLTKSRLFDITHINDTLKNYREQVTKVGRGYKSATSCTGQTPKSAIALMMNNHFYDIKSQEEVIELIYLAKARGVELPSPIWHDEDKNAKQTSIYFSIQYLKELEKHPVHEAKQRTKIEAEKKYGVFIPLNVIEQYIGKVIKSPYRKETNSSNKALK